MSPSGKARPEPGAGDVASLASARLDREGRQASLPLRLSVARGGLGLELARPIAAGPLLVDELEVELPGLNYPLDLSKGVKQFRSRRSILRYASLRIDTSSLSRAWADALTTSWGPGVRVRLRPVYDGAAELTSTPDEGARNSDGSAGVPSLCVTIHRGSKVCAFDLVVLSGTSPRIAIDGARALGFEEPPLLLAMQAVDAGLRAAMAGDVGVGVSLSRTGRSIQMGGLAEAVALFVLPSLGCRLPQVTDQVVTSVQHAAGEIRIVLGRRGEPFSAGRRALWVVGVADFLLHADEALGRGELARARELYIEALERAPGHPEALLLLSELDLAAGNRGEAALSFLQELEGLEGVRFSSMASARTKLALSRAISLTGRQEIVGETLARALTDESDAVMQALIGMQLAHAEVDLIEKRQRLDAAVARAPFLKELRWARFWAALQMADFRTAAADAEQLEAAETKSFWRADVCHKVGMAFRTIARGDDAAKWFRRGLRLCPDDAGVMLRLAECLIDTGENVRAAELLQAAVQTMVAEVEKSDVPRSADGENDATNPERAETVREMLSEARFLLGQLLLREEKDAHSALVHLCAVETRSRVGTAARLAEAEIHHHRGQYSARDRVLSRLLEAVEMRWIDLEPHADRLAALLKQWGSSVESSVLTFAEHHLAGARARSPLHVEES